MSAERKISFCVSLTESLSQGSVEMKRGESPFALSLSKFRLTGENICGASSLGISEFGKDLE